MIYLELLTVLALILLNGSLAMAELAIVSSRRGRLQALVDRDVIGSRRALALAADPGRFLSTVQIGITLVGILSGALSGATLGLRLSDYLETIGVPDAFAEYLGVGLVVAVITYASLIAGELVPKQIALRDPEGIAVKVAPAMTVLARVGSPLVSLLDLSGNFVLRLLGYRPKSEQRVTEEEVRMLLAEAETVGVLEEGEREMISGVMRLGDRPVRAIMTPRRDVDMIDLSRGDTEINAVIMESVHSRLPVQHGGTDEILGVIHTKDLLIAYLRGERPSIRDQLRAAPTVLDTADALDMVRTIKGSSVHMALVFDEYGHFEGVVTHADILDAIIGASVTDEGPPEPGMVAREDGSWLISGSMPADEVAERLTIDLPADRSYQTVAGFALLQIGQLPAVGETFDAFGWRFEVVDLDGRRIDKLLAKRIGSRRALRR